MGKCRYVAGMRCFIDLERLSEFTCANILNTFTRRHTRKHPDIGFGSGSTWTLVLQRESLGTRYKRLLALAVANAT